MINTFTHSYLHTFLCVCFWLVKQEMSKVILILVLDKLADGEQLKDCDNVWCVSGRHACQQLLGEFVMFTVQIAACLQAT